MTSTTVLRRRLMATVFGSMIALLVFPSQAAEEAVNGGGRTYVGASSNNFPPINILGDDGELDGFGRELSDAVIEATGGTVRHIHSNIWVNVLKWLDEGKADFIHDTGYAPDRTAYLDYSDPIIEMPEEIFVRNDQFDIQGFDDLLGKKVVCVNRHITHIYLEKLPNIDCLIVKTPLAGLNALLEGKADAFIYPRQIVLYLAQKSDHRKDIKKVGDPLRTLTWSMTVKKDNAQMLRVLNSGIAKVKASGRYDEIYNKWFGYSVTGGFTEEEVRNLIVVAAISSLAAGGLMVMLISNRRLRRANRLALSETIERRRTEKELQILNAQLEDRVVERTHELDREKKRAENYLNIAGTMIVALDKSGTITLINRMACEVLNWDRREITGKNWFDTVIPESARSEVMGAFRQIMNGDLDPVEHFENEVLDRDGNQHTIVWRNTYLRDEEGDIVGSLSAGTDETENRKMQTKMIQSSKMATLGEMATGVAHELNQPLNVIRMAVSNVQRKLKKGNTDPDYLIDKLDKIDSQVRRAAAIIDHMRIFGRRSDADPMPLDPKQMIDSTLGLIGAQLRLAEIEVIVDAVTECRPILGHQVQIEQVLLNLISNARDALEDRIDGAKHISISAFDSADQVVITIEDNGGGVPENVLLRIFEPFFTTKKIGQGTGLGLSISYGIIADMGGTIIAENISEGARFTISLPAIKEDAVG